MILVPWATFQLMIRVCCVQPLYQAAFLVTLPAQYARCVTWPTTSAKREVTAAALWASISTLRPAPVLPALSSTLCASVVLPALASLVWPVRLATIQMEQPVCRAAVPFWDAQTAVPMALFAMFAILRCFMSSTLQPVCAHQAIASI